MQERRKSAFYRQCEGENLTNSRASFLCRQKMQVVSAGAVLYAQIPDEVCGR